MKEVVGLIQSVGFPIVIALLFYLDLRKVINCNTRAIDGLTYQQKQLLEVLKNSRG